MATKKVSKSKSAPAVDDRTSYSKEELDEFRVIIKEKLVEAREEHRGQQDSLRNSTEMALLEKPPAMIRSTAPSA